MVNTIFGIIVFVLLFAGYAVGNTASSLPQTSDNGDVTPAPQENAGDSNQTGITVKTSDSSITGQPITNDPATWPGDDNLWNVCAAIALAEGYNNGSGCAPFDLNNPGDLSPGDEHGEETAGGAQWHGGSYIIVFAVAEGGWRALRAKFQNIVNGNSTVYPKTYTWAQVAARYAGNSANWLKNVTSYLGVDSSSTPAQYVNGA